MAAARGQAKFRAYELGEQSGVSLRLVERPALVPGPGEVVMKVRATGLGARDILIITGGFGGRRPAQRIPLQDSAGEIMALGPGVAGFKIGDKVSATHYPKYID